MKDFYQEICLILAKSIGNYYPENFDREIKNFSVYRHAVVFMEGLVSKLGRLLLRDLAGFVISKKNFYFENISGFKSTYDLLNNEESRGKYIELLAYRMLGFTKVKLSLNEPRFWAARESVTAYRQAERLSLSVNFKKGYLDLYDLSKAGYDNLKLYFVQNGIFVDFILQQYNYNDIVCVNKGDIVVDAGGCWGDTALYFTARGAKQVFVYEFIPSNIKIFNQNILLNPQYANQIKLIEKPVWETSGLTLSFEDHGPASRVAEVGVYAETTQTLSIDDMVNQQGLSKVDFIKMDIEGAELSALKGAEQTIRLYKPKLAISVYHRPDDLITIPAYIQSINSDYEFYLDYYTIVGDEIMLYAIDNNAK